MLLKKNIYEIVTEIDLSEAGERFMTDDGNFIGKSSSFPKWIPEELRIKKII